MKTDHSKRNGYIGLGALAVLTVATIVGSDPLYEFIDSKVSSGTYAKGTYTYEDGEFDESGYKDQVSVTIEDGVITQVSWDCVDADGNTKSQLCMDGEYIMTEDGLRWYEQAEAVADYVIQNQSVNGLTDESGYTDAVASVSINLSGFVTGVEECLKQAAQ